MKPLRHRAHARNRQHPSRWLIIYRDASEDIVAAVSEHQAYLQRDKHKKVERTVELPWGNRV
jgi:predicted hydrolase (HD superfamily)